MVHCWLPGCACFVLRAVYRVLAQARRNLSDHARLLASLPSEEPDIADADEYKHRQQQQHQQQSSGFTYLSEERRQAGLSSTGRDRGGHGDAARNGEENDGMAIDDGQASDTGELEVWGGAEGGHGESCVYIYCASIATVFRHERESYRVYRKICFVGLVERDRSVASSTRAGVADRHSCLHRCCWLRHGLSASLLLPTRVVWLGASCKGRSRTCISLVRF